MQLHLALCRVIVRNAHSFSELARSYRDQLVEYPFAVFTLERFFLNIKVQSFCIASAEING